MNATVQFDVVHERKLDAFATGEIFQRRARKYRRLVRWLTFFGLAIPVLIGGIVLANLFEKDLLGKFIYASGALAVIQLAFSLWSVVADWSGSLEYSSAASSTNHRLANQFTALAATEKSPPADADEKYIELRALDDAQRATDDQKDVSEAEKVYGHRAALKQFMGKCDVCDQKPISMKMPLLAWQRCPRCGGPKKR